MANSIFKINGVPIKNPSGFKIERFNVTNMERLADATMAGDLIAKKKKFYFTYAAITAADLDVILAALWDTLSLFFTLTYQDRGTTKTATVYVGAIPTLLHSAKSSEWVWKDVAFNLIQQ